MKGYFISDEKAKELGLLDKPNIAPHLQKTIVAITQNDISEYQQNVQLEEHQINEMANWFYENYYDNLINTFNSFGKK